MHAEKRGPFALGLVFAAVFLGVGGGGAASAQHPEPHFELAPGTVSDVAWDLTITVPDGWALYAPDTGSLGLPLTAHWIPADPTLDTSEVRLDGPPGRHESSPAGPVRVYRGRVALAIADEGSAPERDLEVRWALCQANLCVPGRTRVAQKIR
ncbi:MAG: protein-disulfide reductase DsbD N-terminal domain-containing protein [Gemmatimonadetes bacterium]|nr:protein-disulfide reductase DsbD N-terminal domain-containing protein [Gemmatimonadota bacterium]